MKFCPSTAEVSSYRGRNFQRRLRLAIRVPQSLARRYFYRRMKTPKLQIGRLLVASGLATLCGACASTGVTPRPFPLPSSPPSSATPLSPPPADEIAHDDALVGTALALRGIPYRNGGADLGGFDCSGFTQFVFGKHGLALPRAVREQFKAGRSVEVGSLAPGDLLFFETTEPGPSHVAIAVGGDAFVHAPSSRGAVRVERLHSSYWSARLIGVRRLALN